MSIRRKLFLLLCLVVLAPVTLLYGLITWSTLLGLRRDLADKADRAAQQMAEGIRAGVKLWQGNQRDLESIFAQIVVGPNAAKVEDREEKLREMVQLYAGDQLVNLVAVSWPGVPLIGTRRVFVRGAFRKTEVPVDWLLPDSSGLRKCGGIADTSLASTLSFPHAPGVEPVGKSFQEIGLRTLLEQIVTDPFQPGWEAVVADADGVLYSRGDPTTTGMSFDDARRALQGKDLDVHAQTPLPELDELGWRVHVFASSASATAIVWRSAVLGLVATLLVGLLTWWIAWRKLSHEVAVASKLQSMERVGAILVHDFKNLSNQLGILMHNLRRNFDDPEFRADAERTLQKSVDRIARLTRRFDLPRDGDVQEHVLMSPDDAVREVLQEFDPRIREPVMLHERLECEDPVLLQRDLLQETLRNLVDNAIDAMPEGGKLTVETRGEDGRLVLIVADEGVGMTEEFIATRLFRPFETTKRRGLGFGLWTAKQRIEGAGGSIGVEATPGRGSRFRLSLPFGSPMIPEPVSHG